MKGLSPNTETLLAMPSFATGDAMEELRVMPSELQDMERECDALCQRAAWLSTYLGARGADGCGDHGDSHARQYADKQVKRIRKTIGYTYP